MKRMLSFIRLFLCVFFVVISIRMRGQTPAKNYTVYFSDTEKVSKAPIGVTEVVQAPYYDAVELLYALHNFKAYPLVAATATPNFGGAPAGQNSGPSADGMDDFGVADTGTSTNSYILLEAETGKVLFGPSNDTAAIMHAMLADTFSSATEQKQTIIKIVQRNTWNGANLSDDSIWAQAKANPYFFTPHSLSPNIAGALAPQLALPSLFNTGSQVSPLITIGGANPFSATTIAQGIAQLLISRVNKEFENNFIDILVNYLQNKHPEVGILFPQTLKALQQFQLTQYKSSYTAIQNACQTDIAALLGNVSGLTKLAWCKKMLIKYPPLVLLFSSCDMVDMLKQNVCMQEVIYRLGNASYVNDVSNVNSYTSFVRLVALVSNSLRDIQFRTANKSKQGWIDTDKIAYLLKNPAIYQTFLGIVLQNSTGIRFTINGNVYDFHQLLLNAYSKLVVDSGPVYNLAQQILNGKAVVASFSTTLQTKPPQLINYVTAFSSMADYLLNLSQAGVDLLYGDTANTIRMHVTGIKAICMPIISDLDSIAYDIAQQRYASSVGEGLQLLNSILAQTTDGKSKVQRVLISTTQALQQEIAGTQGAATVSDSIPTDSVGNFISFINTYGQFFGAIAEAQNSQDIANVLDAFALPPGSSRAQKENAITLGLNAYVNVYHSWNKQYSNTPISREETGFSAPIGFAFSVGLCHGKGGAFTAFAGLLDVGAIFSYQVSDTNTIKSSIQWGQLFAPSFSIIYDAPLFNHKKFNLPLEIGAGWQWGPRLQKVTETGNSTLPFLTERFNVFIGFDIPLLHLYSRKRS